MNKYRSLKAVKKKKNRQVVKLGILLDDYSKTIIHDHGNDELKTFSKYPFTHRFADDDYARRLQIHAFTTVRKSRIVA